jgi:hypothetical protein
LIARKECNRATLLFVNAVLPELLSGSDLLELAVLPLFPVLLQLEVLVLLTRQFQQVCEDLIEVNRAAISKLSDRVWLFWCRR